MRSVTRRLVREQELKCGGNGPANIWKVIKKRRISKIEIKDVCSGTVVTEPGELAGVFRSEFIERNKPCAADECEIQELLKISSEELLPKKRWKFKFVDKTQVINAINTLKNSNMAGPDQIQAQFLKAVKY